MNLFVAPTSSASGGSSRARLRITRTEYRSAPVSLAGTASTGPRISVAQEVEGEPGCGYEEVYRIKGELPGGHWLYYAVPVYVRIEGAEYVAVQPHLALHAFGESPVDAILNLRDELVEHYERLEAMGDRLVPPLVRQREKLRKLLTGRDA